MTAYFIRRLLLMIPTLIGCTIVMYMVMREAPGGPIERMKQEQMMKAAQSDSVGAASGGMMEEESGGMTEEEEQRMMKELGISDNALADYFRWLKGIVTLDFGKSNRYNTDVLDMIKSKIPISLFFGLFTMFAIYGICIPLGMAKAIKHKTMFDNLSSLVVFTGYAIPGYALGSILVAFVGAKWQVLPLGGFVGENFAELAMSGRFLDLLLHAIMPLCCYLIGGFAFMTMLMKNQLLDNMASDYVRTALAKGVPYKRAIFKHALDNSLIPIATTFGNQLRVLISGSFLIEKIFNIDGMGMLGFNALMDRDYNVIMGVMVISTFISLFGNILSDLCVAYVDPRVKFG